MAEANTEEKPKGGSKLVLILLVVLIVLLLAGGGVTAWLFMSGKLGGATLEEGGEQAAQVEEEAPAAPLGPPVYFSLGSPLTVNFSDTSDAKLMQVEIQFMTYDPTLADKVKPLAPEISNNLIMLFSQQSAVELRTREGKEALRAAALEEVRAVLVKRAGIESGLEDVFFTRFVMQ